MQGIILSILFFGIPLASVVLFVVSLVRYISAKRAIKRQPDTCEKRELIARRNVLIVASCIAGVLVAVVVAIVILLWMAIAFM